MRLRLLAAFVGLVFILLLVQDVPLSNYLSRVEHEQILTSLERDAWRLASQNDTAIAYGYNSVLNANTLDYSLKTNAKVVVTDISATVIATTVPNEMGTDFSNRPEIAQALKGVASSGSRASTTLGEQLLYVAVPVESRGVLVGAIRISYPESEVAAVVRDRVKGILIVALFTLLITIIASLLIANAVTGRLRRLHRATLALAGGDLSVRVNTDDGGGAPELHQLELAFDSMVERLSAVLESQRSFASDASHQLRTPLTALRLQLESASETVENPTVTAEKLEAASGEVVRLQMLIDGLLALARLEGSAPSLQRVDVSQMMRERIEMWQPLAEEKSISLQNLVSPNLTALAAPGMVDQIVDAYLDNALDFAPANSVIQVRADAVKDAVEIHIIDSGPGLNAEQFNRAFDRFWRGRTDGSGTGLGLAIVARIAAAIGAQVGLQKANTGGVDAYLKLQKT